MKVGDELTVEYVSKLINQVKQSSIPGKSKTLTELKNALDLLNRGIKLYFKPQTSVFIAANQVFVNSVDVEIEE